MARDLERLSTAVSSRRAEALAAWTEAVRVAARARGREPVLLDLGPALFGELLQHPAALSVPPGADPAQVLHELALLREALEPLPRAQSRAASAVVAELQRVAAEQLARGQQRAAAALDRVLSAPDPDALLSAVLESAPAIDSCALYAMRGGTLQRRAAAGLARELPDAPDPLVQLAARVREPTSTGDASHESLLEGTPIAAAGLRTLIAVPLSEGGAVLGILEAGSRTAWRLGELDELLLRAAAGRAAALLAQHEARQQIADLEQRLAARAEAQEREALSSAMVASALDAFVAMDAQGRVVEWNAAAERTFGWKREEAVGRAVADLIIPHRLQQAHWEGLRKETEAGQDGPLIGHRTEMPAMHRDGHEFPVELAVTRMDLPGRTLFAGALRDVSERKRADRAARRVTETFQALVEASPLPIMAHDPGGNVLIWNRAAEQVSGWNRGEVIGQPDPFLPPEAHVNAAGAETNGHLTTGLEVRRTRKDGTPVDLSISVAPLRTGRGARPGTIAIAADITESKRAQREAAETAHFREHFVAIVGHDLRNPLTAIVTAAQLLLRHGGLSDRQARTVSRIAASSERMARMIGDLLDFTRSRLGGGFPIETRRMDLGELCEAVIEELELAYPERTIELEARGDAWGTWDPDRIAQVVSNLVGNALQHSPESGTVRVDLRDEGDRVLLETSNAGPPIPPEVLPHIFEPGRRGPPGRGRKESSGLGLGLYIVRQIVLAHGGDISVRSSAEEGTTFTVSLPRRSRAPP